MSCPPNHNSIVPVGLDHIVKSGNNCSCSSLGYKLMEGKKKKKRQVLGFEI